MDIIELIVQKTLIVRQNLEYTEQFIDENQSVINKSSGKDDGTKCLYLAFEITNNDKDINQVSMNRGEIN